MKEIHDDTSVDNPDVVTVEEPVVFFRKPIALEVPLAAAVLSRIPVAERAGMVARLLDLGAEAYNSFHSLAGARQLEVYLDTLAPKLMTTLSQTMQKERQITIQDVQRVLGQHDIDFAKALAERQTTATKGTFRGRPLEEAISAKLTQLMMPMGGQVERCADNLGARRRKYGDHLITLDPDTTHGQPLRIVVEVKSRSEGAQRFNFAAVREICQQARVNRGAAASIFVADSADILPDGLSFGQLSPTDYFAAFNADTGDDTAVAVALRLAMVAALATVESMHAESIDHAAAGSVIANIRQHLDGLSKIESHHTRAKLSIESAGTYLEEQKAHIQVLLRRLDQILGL